MLGFVQATFTRLIGEAFWGLIMLIIVVPLYIRYQSIIPIVIVFLGLGPLMIAFVPYSVYNLGYVLLGLGMAGLLYKLFTVIKR